MDGFERNLVDELRMWQEQANWIMVKVWLDADPANQWDVSVNYSIRQKYVQFWVPF